MRFINILATCVLGTSAKQIFLGVPPFDTVDETLSIDYGTVSVSPPGRVLPLNIPVQAPRVGVPNVVISKGPYLLITVDPDSSRPYVLHWLQPNVIPSLLNDATNVTNLVPLNNTPALATYREPRPPAGSGPHRYTFLLFLQPQNFTIPPSFSSFVGPEPQRPNFDFPRFVAETGLGKPVAANYFVSENSTTSDKAASGPGNATSRGTGAIPNATTTPFTGGAGTSHIVFSLAILSGLCAAMLGSFF